MRVQTAILVAAAALALPASSMADWPMYGHDRSNTRNGGDEGVPPSKVGSMPQAWSFKSDTGDFTGTPVVADGVVVAGDNGGSIYALDAVNGKVLWAKKVGQPVTGSAAIDLRAPGGPAVYVPVAQQGSPRLLALSLADGSTRWDTVLTKQGGASVFGSPSFWRGTVYIGTSGPNTDDATARGSLVAVSEASGAIRWQTFTVPEGADGAAVWSTPAIDTATGRLYVGTGNNYHQPTTDASDAMLAFDAATGQIVGKYQATPNDSFSLQSNPVGGPDYDFGASANLFEGPDGRRLVGEGQKSGTYWTLDRATMKPVWRNDLGPGGPLGGILGSTAFDGTRIYGADTLDGQVFALGRDGSAPWESVDAGVLHVGATTVADGVLYTIDPNGFLNARDPATGAVLTKIPLGGGSFGGISATGGALYVAVGTGPPPEPAPQQDGSGSIIAFGDTSRSGGAHGVRLHRRALHKRRAHRRQRAHQAQAARAQVARSNSFDGTCSFSGPVHFDPAMTNTPQTIQQYVRIPGTCSGTFVDSRGRTHQLSDAPTTFTETSTAANSSCLSGTATGTGALIFQFGKILFSFSETRPGATPLLTLTGARSGSANGVAHPSQSEDAVADAQACNGAGLEQFNVDAEMTTTPTISG